MPGWITGWKGTAAMGAGSLVVGVLWLVSAPIEGGASWLWLFWFVLTAFYGFTACVEYRRVHRR